MPSVVGTVTAQSPGDAIITGTYHDHSGSVSITVTAN